MENLSNKVITSYRVVGAKAGEAKAPKTAKDSVASLSTAKILYGLNDGEISGIVGGARGIKLEDTPLEDEEGNSNFNDGVTWDFRSGTIDQEYIEGFPDLNNEIGVGLELKSTASWIRAISNPSLTAVRVRFSWNGLRKTNTKTGDVSGYKIEYAIDIKTTSGAYQEVLRTFIDDKVTGKYERTHRVELPKSSNGWQIRIRRITANANLDNIIDKMYIEALTEVIDQKFTYPHTTLLGLQYDAITFSGKIAKLAVRAKGKLIKIPSNYDPVANTYTGVWNGQFKLEYSDNPAWIFYDLVLSDRYGLGRRIDASMIDKWALYVISQYCDELVDDGEGGLEKRYSCNVYIQKQEEAYKVLSQLAGIFRGLTYWSGQQLVLSADVPKEPSYIFSRANVIDGDFEYSGTALNDRHTVAKVAWDNPNENFKTEYEVIRDEEAISQFGINEVTLAAMGCTSRGQAQRAGLWALKSEQLETEVVSFRTGLEGFNVVVGEVIEISDSLLAGRENGGRIVEVSSDLKSVTIDRDAIVKVNDFISVNAKDGTSQRRKVIEVSGRLLTVLTPFVDIEAGSVWAESSTDLTTMLFRVMSVKPDEEKVYTITAIQYEPLKYDAVDNGADVKPTNISLLKPTNVESPSSVSLSANYRVVQGLTITTLVIQWAQVKDAVGYRVEWRRNSGNWIKIPTTANVSAEVDGIYSGDYQVRVKSINAFDVESNFIISSITSIAGKVGNPKALASISATGILFGMDIKWSFTAGSEDTAYTEIETATSSSGANTATLGSFSYPTDKTTINGLQGGLKIFYRGRIVDKLGNFSSWSNWVAGTTDADATKVLNLLEGQITESQLYTSLSNKIDKIDTNKTILDDLGLDLNQKINDTNDTVAEANRKLVESKALIDANKLDLTKANTDIDSANVLIKANKDNLVLTNTDLVNAKDLIKVNRDKLALTDASVLSSKVIIDKTKVDLAASDVILNQAKTDIAANKTQLVSINKTVGDNKLSIDNSINTLIDKDTVLTNSISTFKSEYNTNKASVTSDISTLTNKDIAIVKDINSLNSKTNLTDAEITTIKTTVADNTKAIATTKTELTASYNALEIGGANLLPNTVFNTDYISGYSTGNYYLFDDKTPTGGIRVDCGDSVDSVVYGFIFKDAKSKKINLRASTTYTLSFYGQSTGISLNYCYIMRDSKPNLRLPSIAISSGYSTHRSMTFTLEEDVVNGYLLIGGYGTTGSWFALNSLTLQRGNKASAWSKSPLDFDDAIAVSNARITAEATARSDADTALTNTVNTLKSDYDGNKASVSQSLTALVNKDIALSEDVRTLTASYEGSESKLVTDLKVLTDKDTSLASLINTLDVDYKGNKSKVTTDIAALVTKDVAMNTLITNLDSDYKSNKSTVSNALTTLSDKDKSLVTDISTINATVAGNAATIESNNTALVTKTTALTNSINTINSEYATNKANVTRDLLALTTKDTAIVKDINSLNTKTDLSNTEISTIKTAVADNKTSIAKTKTDLTTEFNNLELGGANLIRQSVLTPETLSLWNNSSVTYYDDKTDTGAIRIDAIEETKSFGFTFKNAEAKKISLKAGVEYTLSFRGQANFNSLNYCYVLRSGSPNIALPSIAISSGGNTKRSLTFTLTEDVTNGYILIGGINRPSDSWFSVSGLTLQRGNKATDWSLSPYDLEDSIGINKASISAESTARSDADVTLTNSINTLKSSYDTNKAAVTSSLSTLTNKDVALTESLTTLDSDYKGNKASVAQSLTTLTAKDVSLTNSLTSLTTSVGNNSTAITNETKSRSDADNALSTRIATNLSKADNALGRITTAETTISNHTTAIAKVRTDLEADFNEMLVGGYNLLPNTIFSYDNIQQYSDSTIWIFKDDSVAGGVRATNDILERGVFGFIFKGDSSKKINIKAGLEYTLSFYGSATANISVLDYCYIMNSGTGDNKGIPSIAMNADYNDKKSITFTINEDITDGYLLMAARGVKDDQFWVGSLTLQQGNKSTEWSQSPLDFDNELVKSNARITAEALTRSTADNALTTRLDTLTSGFGNNKSLSTLTTELKTYADNDKASASKFNALTSGYENKSLSTIVTDLKTYSDKDKASASSLTNLTASFDNLEIGGQNILPNSDFSKGYTAWNSTTYISQGESELQYGLGLATSVKNIGDDTNSFGVYAASDYRTAKIKEGETYTLSWLGQGTFSNLNYVHLLSRNQRNYRLPYVPLKVGRSNKYEITFVAPYTTNDLNILLAAVGEPKNAWFSVSQLMLQKGNKATAWTPSPLDAEAGIAANAGKITAEAKVAADANKATADELKTVSAKANGNSGTIQTINSTLATHTTAIASTKTTLEAQVIGGDNLILDSTFKKGVVKRGTPSIYTGQSEGYETPYVKATSTEDNSSFGFMPDSSARKIRVLAGEEYTLSFFGQATFATLNYIYLMSTSKSNQFLGYISMGSGMRNKKSLTFTADADLDDGYILLGGVNLPSGSWFAIGGLQLQRGNKATTWQPSANEIATSLEETKSVVAGVSAEWSLKLDVNGYVSGIGQYNNGATSQFAVRADNFYIANPITKTASIPFQVLTSTTVINGVQVPAGTYIKDAFISNGTITNAKIANAAITNAKIGNLAVDTAQIANSAIENAKIANAAITTAKIGTAQVDSLQIKGEAVIVPRVQFTASDFEFRTIDTEEVINSITINADGGGVSISFGFEKLFAIINNKGQSPAVTLRLKRGSTTLRTLKYEEGSVTKLSTGGSSHYLYSSPSGNIQADNITLPTILDNPPSGNQTYTVTLESRGLNSGKDSSDQASTPVIITARSLHIMGAKR